jgi:anti-sigma-K factor RskA
MDVVSEGCAPFRLALGTYVLGALHPSERAEVRAHLDGCSACREELTLLAAVPPALARLSERQAAALAREDAPHAPSETLLQRIGTELVRRRRRLQWRRRLAGGLAVAVAAAGIAAGVALGARGTPSTPGPGAVAAHLQATDPGTGVSATADVFTRSWGSSIHLTVSGVPGGDQCELVAVGSDGTSQVAGTWNVGYSGAVDIWGDAGMRPDQMTRLEVETTGGQALVSLPMSPRATA